jgi:peptide methionine sulfoxide reductase msrA/msrB
MVQVHVFDRHGKLVGPVESPRVELSDAEWQQRLSPEQFRILRNQGTERPFCGTLLDNKKQGVYTCAGCGLPLFESGSKFNSGTGWPSFFQPIAKGNVLDRGDDSHGMVRDEIICARCDGHLGHVFPDGPKPTGLRFCLNSESLNFTPSDQLASLADPLAAASTGTGSSTIETATAIFAGGCFWCTEAAFEQLAGVHDVTSGYIGGDPARADYKSVCTGTTGHAEAIRITYDPSRIGFEQLLDVFFDAHDPTQLNGQGNDIGTQYRSAIFFADDGEKEAAERKIAALNAAGKFAKPIVTKLEPQSQFHPAEDYHQDYARLNPDQPYIQAVSMPKACKVRDKHAGLMRK